MTNNHIQPFPTHTFPVGDYRAIVIDSRVDEITDGIVTIYLELMLVNLKTNDIYTYCDTIVNHTSNPRSRDFFDFLTSSCVQWEQYEDLKGLTFDATVVFEQYGDVVLPILCNRKILAKPPCVEE